MPLWSCNFEACTNPAVQKEGDCLCCDRHLCRKHSSEPFHTCPNPEENWSAFSAQYAATEARHIDELCNRIDGPKLCSRASEIRGGIPCTVDLSRKHLSSMMGHQNCHAEIVFKDKVRWLARLRLTRTTSPPEEVRDCILRSEAATLTYLQDRTSIPAPRIFDWACESDLDNSVGVGYILMEKLDGNPLDWQAATLAQREKIMQQLVDVFLEIERHPFGSMGSLFEARRPANFVVQGLAQHATYRMGAGGPIGPFASSLEGSVAIVKSYLAMIASGEIGVRHSVDNYLAHRFRLDVASSLCEDDPADQFFLKHPDDKGDHILVNESYDIVGIIDWEWTRTASKAEAFSSPCMMWPVGEFYRGSNELDPDEVRLAKIFEERGRKDLSDCVLNGRKAQRFYFAMGPESPSSNRKTLIDLFLGLTTAFNFESEGWEQWRRKALIEWKDDELLQGLIRLDTSDESQ